MTLFVPSSFNLPEPIAPGDDVLDIGRRVQDGDATVGWRGDSGMDTWRSGHSVRVYGFDRTGQRYVAAEVRSSAPDWREELLRKLRDGDWQNPKAYEDMVTRANDELEIAHNKELAEQTHEVAEKFAFAAERDNGIKRTF